MNSIRSALVLLTLIIAAPSHGWWNEDWNFRKEFTVDTSATGAPTTGSVLSYPLLVRLHLGNFTYFGDTLPDGADLRFVAGDDVTPLAYHVERFDPASQVALIWVQIPQIAPNAPTQTFYMYYGNPEAVAGGVPAQTYDKNDTLVLHFDGPRPAGDVTAYAHVPASSNFVAEPAGLIAGAARFSGEQAIEFQGSPALNVLPEKGWTFSTWVKLEAAQSLSLLTEHADVVTGRLTFQLDGFTPMLELVPAGDAPATQILASADLQPGVWHHFAYVLDGSGVKAYLDGSLVLEHPFALPQFNGAFSIGGSARGASRLLGAVIDEVRVSNSVRSAERIRLEAASEGMSSNLLRYGEDTVQDADSESHFVTTLRNVQWSGLEGWVIFLCVFMAIGSWYVMVTKVVLVERVRRANERFLEQYRAIDHLADLDTTGPAAGERFAPSTLAEVYSLGVSEIRQRIARGADAGLVDGAISGEALDAVRSTLVGHNVRLSQRLSNLLVLLTLAIAGGPFLGLLGTVVGVIVTFAGIAASGDVNINAIAPGIAAALVATVAGLGVAIPALFGYNYISSRIKEVITEDNVFLEEFMAVAIESHQTVSRYAN